MCQEFGYSHLSVGDHLRELAQSQSETIDQHVIDCIQRGELLPVDDLLPILRDAVTRLEEKGPQVIFVDGFPRHKDQVDLEDKDTLQPTLVLFFDCGREVARERYLTRALAGRDDSEEIFTRRYEEFIRLNPPVIERYADKGILLTVIFVQRNKRRQLTIKQVDTSTDTSSSYQELLRVVRAGHPRLCRPSSARSDREIEADC